MLSEPDRASIAERHGGVKTRVRHNISLMRQALVTQFDPRRDVSVVTLAHEFVPGSRVPDHAHGSDQLIYATHGVMEVSAERSSWLIPPQFSVWIPARMTHRIRMPGRVSMRTLYFRRGLVLRPRDECSVLHVTPLLGELVVEAVRIGSLRTANRLHRALRDLIVSHLEAATSFATRITLPKDPRAAAVGEACISGQADGPSLISLCRKAGVSVRTIERVFQREVGMSFESWRRQVRVMKAIELLVGGCPVKKVAAEVGYQQSSAFVEMFRRALGQTPRAWVAELNRRRT